MKKKVIIIALVIIAFISSASFITFKVVSKDSRNVNQLSNPVKEEKEKESIAEDEKDDSKENQEESKTNDSDQQKEEVKEEPKQETSNNNTTSNKTYNNNSNNNITTPKQEEVPKQNNVTKAPDPAPTKSCTPKKFYSTFRADEDIKSMDDCNSKGALYKSVYGYIGYSCDYQTDDCGDLYYMLQMIDENGQEHGYNTIPKP